MSNRPRHRARAFTLMESLVLIGILIVLLSIFIPYVSSIRESSRRATCEMNLYQIKDAMKKYAGDNGYDYPRVRYDGENNPNGYTAFTGPDEPNPFAEGSAVQPNDVTASLWLLVHIGYVIDTRIFICPSTSDTRDLMTDAAGQAVKAQQRGNFRKPSNLSYSYASPFSSASGFRMNDTKRAECALLADKNPGQAAIGVAPGAALRELARANSPNHRGAGQNVLFADGSVRFMKSPYSGVGYQPVSAQNPKPIPGDNIYSAQFAGSTSQPASMPMSVAGVIGFDVAPVSNDDSYLVPTATDPGPAPIRISTTLPSTAPSPDSQSPPTTAPETTPASTTAPATTAQ